jgi:hypothetical protein
MRLGIHACGILSDRNATATTSGDVHVLMDIAVRRSEHYL